MRHRSQTALAAGVLAAAVAAPLVVSPQPQEAPFGGINLGSCVVTLSSTSQLKTSMTAVGWEESANGLTIKIYPQSGVDILVGDSLGNDPLALPTTEYSTLQVEKTSDTVLEVTLTRPQAGGGNLVDVIGSVTAGTFDPLAVFKEPFLEDFGTVPGDPTRKRLRLRLDYYGLRSAVTLIDG